MRVEYPKRTAKSPYKPKKNKCMKIINEANLKTLNDILNQCIEIRVKSDELITSDYHFNSLAAKIAVKLMDAEDAILDCINELK